MGWLRRLLGGEGGVDLDPGRQQALLRDVQRSYGAHARIRFPEQVDAISHLLSDDDGLVVAAGIVCEAADEAHADLQSQAQEVFRRTGRRLLVHRRNYRPLWKEAGPALRWPLGALPSGLHPYAQVTAAVSVIGDRAKRLDRVTDPQPFVARLFEVLDLTTAGWEFGRVRVDTDGATLVERLTVTAAQVLAAMDDPPRLPPAVRELMRRNHRIDVYDPAGPRVVGRINLGARLRETLLA
ncbi:hypothetical protein O7602_15955 [Micromonospora sp. WMMD1128]|uniref:hypothetical protein n=1 Tax=unclassified Micromonospora TaxID=2617518 RepID=UPI00248B4551|nr:MULTISPECIES: hypothetical protein [unclassified Micromonospora]WBB71255.1 hypothetical protein O7602_15955 [Micromonospora sp. WMMD1128]WFE35270.1 hypothetical protein O7613_07790 [Micromonospora sp. WMMD975]